MGCRWQVCWVGVERAYNKGNKIKLYTLFNILIDILSMKEIIIMCVLAICIESTTYNKDITISTLQNISGMVYSYDQSYLLIYSNTSFTVYNGVTLSQLQSISQPTSQASFSFNNQFLAVVENKLKIILYRKNQMDIGYENIPFRTIQYPNEFPILGISFSRSNTLLAVSQNSSVDIFDIQYSAKYEVDTSSQANYSIIVGEDVITMGWNEFDIIAIGTNSRIEFYSLTDHFQNAFLSFPRTSITMLDLCQENILVTVSGTLFQVYDTFSGKNVIFQQDLGQNLKSVSCSRNAKNILTETSGNNYIIWNRVSSQQWNMSMITRPTLLASLSSIGSDIIEVESLNKFTQYSVCAQAGQFYNPDNDACQTCSMDCQICHRSNTSCYTCKSYQYLSNFKCVGCPQGCSSCYNSIRCYTCSGDYSLDNSAICVKQLIGTLGIVLIALGCAVVVVIIVVLVVLFIRRRRKQKMETALLLKKSTSEQIQDDYNS